MKLLDLLFFLYQKGLSPALQLLFGPSQGCRFEPSCSVYSHDAFHEWGFWKGLWLTFARLVRCQPFSRAGYDPVPRAIDEKKELLI